MWRSIPLLAVSLLTLAGCNDFRGYRQGWPDRPGGSFRVQRLGPCDYQEAFAAAVSAVSEQFRVVSANADSGIITCEPDEFTRAGARMRRTARLQLRRQKDQVIAACRVQVERHATAGARSWSRHRSADDLPTATPIQEDAGLSPEQEEYWATEGRDYRLERAILDRIAAAVTVTGEPAPSAESPGGQ